MIRKGSPSLPINNCIIGFDAEWTKNYKIKNGNVPFCFSAVSIKRSNLTITNLRSGKISFEYVQFYCEDRNEIKELISNANSFFSAIINSLDYSLVSGHQLSSDFSVFLNIANALGSNNAKNIAKIVSLWRDRKNNRTIFDTRYDIDKPFLGKSRRLVDMCTDFNLDVQQPELANKSMTKLQNQYYDTKEAIIRERLSVMNLRHSFSAVVLTLLNEQLTDTPIAEKINLNKTLNNMLHSDFKWINTPEFKSLV